MKANLIEPGDNEDITAERRAATIDVRELARFIHGGEDVLRRRREILEFVESCPEFRDPVPLEFLSRERRHEEQARKAVAMTDLALDNIDGSDFFGEGIYYQSLIMGRDLHAMSLHYVMFLPTLQGQADDEQLDEWLGLAISRGILGTYAQTELGHGTNLSRLETTATYDELAQEFVLNSPTVTATKWWPGSLGKSSNFAVVMAQLITNGVCRGPHPFIVQLRDLETHQPFKTIQVGDIGPKLGINGSDNGFLIFKNHRIPRRNLLMRHAKVLPNGEYVAPKHNKLAYGSMIFVRSIMIRDQALQLGAAVTIATRYSAVRRQGEMGDSNGDATEVQILDYQTQQYRIVPYIAATLVFLFAASEIRALYLKVTEQILQGDIQLLAEMHALSSGLKSVISWEVAKGIEQCRLACGGHGYSQASGFPEIYAYAVGGCTYEGENIVMLLQVARQLMKAAASVRRGSAHLLHLESYLSKTTKNAYQNDFSSVDAIESTCLVDLFENAARIQIFHAFDLLEKARVRNSSAEKAWNETSVELCRASRLHVKAYLVRNYFEQAKHATSKIAQLCIDLGKMFALYHITTSPEYFARFLSTTQMDALQAGVYALLKRLRPNCVAMVDAFDFSDRELRSVLGRRDGNVYTALLSWAKQSPLNRTEVIEIC